VKHSFSVSVVTTIALLIGCESTALNQDVPTMVEYSGALSPPFYTCLGDEITSYPVEVTFPSATDDDLGRDEDRDIQFSTNCDDLSLEGWSFQSNFRFTLELSRFVSQETHVCEVYLRFENHYGTFDLTDTLTLFACLTGSGS